MFPSPHIVDIVGRLGFDWVLIDCEHGSIGIESVELMVMAAETAGVTPIARPPRQFDSKPSDNSWTAASWAYRCPTSTLPKMPEEPLKRLNTHPLGERGLAAGVRSASYGYGMSMSEYAEHANNETLVCVQLEEAEAVRNVDEIVQVPGVDVFFVGPSDLSQCLGYPGCPDSAPSHGHRIQTIPLRRKLLAPANAQAIQRYFDQGVTYLYTHLSPRIATIPF